MKFSLVIPCYNEEKNIPILLRKYKSFLKNNQLVIVNNGSTDETEFSLKKFAKHKNITIVKIKKNKGFGYGLKKGLLKAKNNFVLYAHADLEIKPREILKSLQILKKNSKIKNIFVKGNRIDKIKNNWSFIDLFFSYSSTVFSSILFRKLIFDVHSQPSLFPKKMLNEIKYIPHDFSIDLAFYVHAKIHGYRVIRYPVNFNKKGRIFGNANSGTIIKKIKSSVTEIYQSIIILFKNI